MKVELSKKEIRSLIKAIEGPSAVDPTLADIYYRLKEVLEKG